MTANAGGLGPLARVLVVDDEPDSRELWGVVLEWDGFSVEVSASGEEALASIAKNPPALVLTDIRMKGMDGYQLTAALKANPLTAHIAVVMLSGISDEEGRTRALDVGAVGFLTKPIDRVTLSSYLRAVLADQASTTGAAEE